MLIIKNRKKERKDFTVSLSLEKNNNQKEDAKEFTTLPFIQKNKFTPTYFATLQQISTSSELDLKPIYHLS